MAKKAKAVIVRMEDPKAKAAPDLSYGKSSISVKVDEDTDGHPLKLTVSCVVDLPEATVAKKLNQDLLAAARIVGEASKYLGDRQSFFNDQIRIRMTTKGVKIEPGFLTPMLTPQNQKEFEWKSFAIETMIKLLRAQDPKLTPKKARIMAEAKCKEKYDKAPVKTHNKDGSKVKAKVSVKGVKLDA
jgi:hypothetical protein